jgi:hypothetical protein
MCMLPSRADFATVAALQGKGKKNRLLRSGEDVEEDVDVRQPELQVEEEVQE